MSEQTKSKKKKRPYVKPEVKKIRLDNEVLLGGNCKTAAGTVRTPGSAGICHTTGMPCAVSTQGS